MSCLPPHQAVLLPDLTYFVSCSVVVEIGPGVRDLVVGDRVAIEPGVPCWTNRASRCLGFFEIGAESL